MTTMIRHGRTTQTDRSIDELVRGMRNAGQYLDRKRNWKWTRRTETTIWIVMAGLIVLILFGAYLTRL